MTRPVQDRSRPMAIAVVDLELSSRRPDLSAVSRTVDAGHRVVVCSHLVDNEVILRCLDLGATSDIAKTEGRMHLLPALRRNLGPRPHRPPHGRRAEQRSIARQAESRNPPT